MRYRAEIDGLRAIAVLPVIFFHAGLDGFSGGFVGVDVFFVISGYLITTIIISEMRNGTFSLLSFYERRARRILPPLFFVMLVCLPFAWLWLSPRDLMDFGQSLVAVSTFSSNVLFWFESGYFEAAAEMKPLLHTWSLAVEEQFYLLFPLLLMLLRVRGRETTVRVLFALLFCSLLVSHFSANVSQDSRVVTANFFLLPTRCWELLIGVLVAFHLDRHEHPISHAVNQIFSLAGLGLVGFSVVCFDQSTPFPSFNALFPTVGTMFLIITAVPGTFAHRLLSQKALVGLGLISYSAYLWHLPLIVFARHKWLGVTSVGLIASLCMLSVFLAWLSWRFVERPFRDSSRVASNTAWRFVITGTLFFVCVGLLLHFSKGVRSRLDYQRDPHTLEASPSREECHTAKSPCEYFASPVRYATFGDSHVAEISYVLASELRAFGIGVQQNSYSACKPNLSDKGSYCNQWTHDTIERIVTDSEIEAVIVSYRLRSYLAEPGSRDTVWLDLLKILDAFVLGGKSVFFVVQPPELPQPIERIILNGGQRRGEIVGWSRREWIESISFMRNRVNEISDEVVVVDPIDWFCDEEQCYGSDSGGYFFVDDNHLSLYGAAVVVENGQMLPQAEN